MQYECASKVWDRHSRWSKDDTFLMVFAIPPTKSPALPHDPRPLPTSAFRLSSHDFKTLLLALVSPRLQGSSPIKLQARAIVYVKAIEKEAKREVSCIWGAFLL